MSFYEHFVDKCSPPPLIPVGRFYNTIIKLIIIHIGWPPPPSHPYPHLDFLRIFLSYFL